MLIFNNIDEVILEILDTETMALITEIKDKLGVDSYVETINIVSTCTNKYKLENLFLTILSKEEANDG